MSRHIDLKSLYKKNLTKKLVNEATSNTRSYMHNILVQITEYTQEQASLKQVFQVIMKKLEISQSKLRSVAKSLVLLEYIVLCGSDNVYKLLKNNSAGKLGGIISFIANNCIAETEKMILQVHCSRLMKMVINSSLYELRVFATAKSHDKTKENIFLIYDELNKLPFKSTSSKSTFEHIEQDIDLDSTSDGNIESTKCESPPCVRKVEKIQKMRSVEPKTLYNIKTCSPIKTVALSPPMRKSEQPKKADDLEILLIKYNEYLETLRKRANAADSLTTNSSKNDELHLTSSSYRSSKLSDSVTNDNNVQNQPVIKSAISYDEKEIKKKNKKREKKFISKENNRASTLDSNIECSPHGSCKDESNVRKLSALTRLNNFIQKKVGNSSKNKILKKKDDSALKINNDKATKSKDQKLANDSENTNQLFWNDPYKFHERTEKMGIAKMRSENILKNERMYLQRINSAEGILKETKISKDYDV